MKLIHIKDDFKPHLLGDSMMVPIKKSKFPGGEVFVRFETELYSLYDQDITLTTRLNSSDDIMELLMVTDAVRKYQPRSVSVFFPYLPYARQDRVCSEGESFSLKVFGNLINSQNYKSVRVIDAHSDVAGGCIDNLFVDDNIRYVRESIEHAEAIPSYSWLVSPDAGALKKIYKVAKELGFENVAVGEKVRDMKTGNIIRTDVNIQDFEGDDVWIVDDICDGGRTFIELAKVLKERNVGKIYLFVTHGIFSKGFSELRRYFEVVYTTNSIIGGGDVPYGENDWAEFIDIDYRLENYAI
jgi:ribose-phosphate pyrophosphokinase